MAHSHPMEVDEVYLCILSIQGIVNQNSREKIYLVNGPNGLDRQRLRLRRPPGPGSVGARAGPGPLPARTGPPSTPRSLTPF